MLPRTTAPTRLAPWFVVNFRQVSGVIWVIPVWLLTELVAGLLAMRVYKILRQAAFPAYRVQRVKINKFVML